ncbi:MAG: hypothetical protein IT514_15365 [Burkholderiales bacterium]|nr:hypothetical protein [Burkholderiales bacterium]
MSQAGYSAVTGGAVALSAATAKSILGVKAHANSGVQIKGFSVGFDGVTASAVPVLVELCYSTFGANSPGTNSTSVTPAQTYGRVLTAGFTAGKTWTAEPTTLTVLKEFLLTPNGGLIDFQYPLGTEPDSALGEGFVLRCTAPATVNVRATMDVERI